MTEEADARRYARRLRALSVGWIAAFCSCTWVGCELWQVAAHAAALRPPGGFVLAMRGLAAFAWTHALGALLRAVSRALTAHRLDGD